MSNEMAFYNLQFGEADNQKFSILVSAENMMRADHVAHQSNNINVGSRVITEE